MVDIEARFPDWQYGHPKILYGLVRSLKPNICVEVGTYRGYAACYMARALKENVSGHLFCIDDFSEEMQKKYDANHWMENLRSLDLQQYASLIVGKSHEVEWPSKVDFAYIDGWHGLETVTYDFNMCVERGAEVICLDDTLLTVGPSLFVQRLREDPAWDVCEIFRDCGLAICVRRREKPPVTFSQELPDSPGTDLTHMSRRAKKQHLDSASRINGLYYGDYDLK